MKVRLLDGQAGGGDPEAGMSRRDFLRVGLGVGAVAGLGGLGRVTRPGLAKCPSPRRARPCSIMLYTAIDQGLFKEGDRDRLISAGEAPGRERRGGGAGCARPGPVRCEAARQKERRSRSSGFNQPLTYVVGLEGYRPQDIESWKGHKISSHSTSQPGLFGDRICALKVSGRRNT
jgi:hypothetical protein